MILCIRQVSNQKLDWLRASWPKHYVGVRSNIWSDSHGPFCTGCVALESPSFQLLRPPCPVQLHHVQWILPSVHRKFHTSVFTGIQPRRLPSCVRGFPAQGKIWALWQLSRPPTCSNTLNSHPISALNIYTYYTFFYPTYSQEHLWCWLGMRLKLQEEYNSDHEVKWKEHSSKVYPGKPFGRATCSWSLSSHWQSRNCQWNLLSLAQSIPGIFGPFRTIFKQILGFSDEARIFSWAWDSCTGGKDLPRAPVIPAGLLPQLIHSGHHSHEDCQPWF